MAFFAISVSAHAGEEMVSASAKPQIVREREHKLAFMNTYSTQRQRHLFVATADDDNLPNCLNCRFGVEIEAFTGRRQRSPHRVRRDLINMH
jgi:hypothetical protein